MTDVAAPGDPAFIRYETSRPAALRDMLARAPIAWVPLGALEWHGEHAPLGLDSFKAAWICERAAERVGGVVFPAMSWGAFHTLRFPFTFRFGKRALRRQVRAALDQLADFGFRAIVLVTGHYPLAQLAMLRAECRRVSARRGVAAMGISEAMLATDIGYLGDHAAKWETSILMAIAPDLVDLAALPADPMTLDERAERLGIFGIDPRTHASADEGRRALDLIVPRLAEAAARLLREGNTDAAEEIYARAAAALRPPIAAGKIAYGTDSAWEVVTFTLRSIWRNRHL